MRRDSEKNFIHDSQGSSFDGSWESNSSKLCFFPYPTSAGLLLALWFFVLHNESWFNFSWLVASAGIILIYAWNEMTGATQEEQQQQRPGTSEAKKDTSFYYTAREGGRTYSTTIIIGKHDIRPFSASSSIHFHHSTSFHIESASLSPLVGLLFIRRVRIYAM